MKKTQKISALVCQEESEESLIDLDSLKDMGIIHKDFPLPINARMREDPHKIRLVNTEINRNPTNLVDILERQGSIRSSIEFHAVDGDTIDIDRELAKIKKRLMQKYHKVFKDKLDKNDRLKIDPIKLELVDNYKEINPTNHMIPFPPPSLSRGSR